MPRCAHVYEDLPKNRERNRVGEQCGLKATNETPFCKFHGGNSSQVIDKYRRDRYEETVRAAVIDEVDNSPGFTGLWGEDHPMLDPFSLLLWEIRRSGARIEWYDARLAEIKDARDLWWGLAKKEQINASEFAGTNKTYEAREHVLLKLQDDERKRLMAARNEWQNNRFEAAKIVGYGAFRSSMRNAIGAIATEFGLDLSEEETQTRLRRALESLPEPIEAIEAPDHMESSRG